MLQIGIFFWKDWKAVTTSCCCMMFITKWEWSYSSWTAFPVSISIFLADIIIVPGGSADLSTSDVPLFWTTLGLVLGDHNEAGSLGFWSAHKEKRILRLSSSAAVITHQQNNNLPPNCWWPNLWFIFPKFSWENWFGSRWLSLWHFSIRSRVGLPREESNQTCSGPSLSTGCSCCTPFKFTF